MSSDGQADHEIKRTIKFKHASPADTDIVCCANNAWINMLYKEQNRLQKIKMDKQRTSHGISIGSSFKNVTCSEAERSFTAEDKKQHDHTCGKVFIKSTADQCNIRHTRRRFGSRKICSSCCSGLQDTDIIFMCPEHKDRILCLSCLGYIAEMAIYAKITKRKIDRNDKMLQYQCQSEFNQSFDAAHKNARYNLNMICHNYAGNVDMESNIYDKIAEFIGKQNIINIVDSKLLLDLFDSCWNFQAITKKNTSTSSYKRRWHDLKFQLEKLDINVSEFEEIQQDSMYEKYVKHNTNEINLEEFKTQSLTQRIWKTFRLFAKTQKQLNNENNLLLGKILDILCKNDKYKFYGLVMGIQRYSYAAHPYYPGGPPQTSGVGESILFRIENKDMIELFVYGYIRNIQQNSLTVPMDIRNIVMEFIDVNHIYSIIKVLNTIYVVSTFQIRPIGM